MPPNESLLRSLLPSPVVRERTSSWLAWLMPDVVWALMSSRCACSVVCVRDTVCLQ
jgi:hypothetical protein